MCVCERVVITVVEKLQESEKEEPRDSKPEGPKALAAWAHWLDRLARVLKGPPNHVRVQEDRRVLLLLPCYAAAALL